MRLSLKPFLIGFLSGILFAGVILSITPFRFTFQSINQEIPEQKFTLPQGTTVKATQEHTCFMSKMNLNSVAASDLKNLPGIGEVKARAIVEFRMKYGYYEDVSELSFVPGLNASLIESIKNCLYINKE